MNKQDNKRTAAVAAAAAIGSAGSAIGTDVAIHTLNSDTAQETDIDNRPENVVHITSQEPHVEVISTSDILNQQNDNHNNHVDPVTPVEPVDPVNPNISLEVMYGGPSGLEDPIGDIEPDMYGGPIDDDLMGVPYIPEEDEMVFLSDDMSTDASVNTDSDMDVIL